MAAPGKTDPFGVLRRGDWLTPERLREVSLVEVIVGRHPATGRLQLSFVPRSARSETKDKTGDIV